MVGVVDISKLKIYFVGFFSVCLYRCLLDLIYRQIISQDFAYYGWVNYSTPESFVFSWLWLLLFIPFFLSFYFWTSQQFLALSMILLFLLKFVPITSLYVFMPMPIEMLISDLLFWFLMFFLSYKLKPIKLPRVNEKNAGLYLRAILFVLIFVVLYISGRYAGFRLNFSLENVYDLREEASQWDYPVLLGYLVSAAPGVLLTMMMFYLLYKNQVWAIILGLIVFLDFSMGGHKATLFLLLVALLVYFFYKNTYLKYIVWAFILLVFISYLENLLFDTCLISGYIIRRGLYVSSFLDYWYFDFFSQHSPDYFQGSFLRRFGFNSAYQQVPLIIGERYGTEGLWANNGLLSDAYLNLGFIGSVIFPFFYIGLFKLYATATKQLDVKLIIIPVLIVVKGLISSSFLTMLLTHGGLLLLFVLYLLPRMRFFIK